MKNKKGFTLVELLVVIAILAILAAVSLVGYNGFVNKANLSVDQQNITMMNSVLKGDEILYGGSRNTPSSAIATLETDFDFIPKTSNHYYGWNKQSNSIVLFDDNLNIVYPTNITDNNSSNYWIINYTFNSEWDSNGYNTYLLDNPNLSGEYIVQSGIDCGNNNIDIKYIGNRPNTIINMAGGSLIIDNDEADVYVYGNASYIEIKNAALSSVHFRASTGTIALTAGHLIIEGSSYVSTIILTERNDTDKSVIIDFPAYKESEITLKKNSSLLPSELIINNNHLTELQKSNINLYTECSHSAEHNSLTGKTEDQIRQLFGADASDWTINEATCTENGNRYFVCLECGDILMYQDLVAPGHTFGEYTIDTYANIYENGTKHRTCSVCNYIDNAPVLRGTDVESIDNMTDTTKYYVLNGNIYESNIINHSETYPQTNVFSTSDPNFVINKRMGSGTQPTNGDATGQHFFSTGYIKVPTNLKNNNSDFVILYKSSTGNNVFHSTTEMNSYIFYDENYNYISGTINSNYMANGGWSSQKFYPGLGNRVNSSLSATVSKTVIKIGNLPENAKYLRINIYGAQDQVLENVDDCIISMYFENEYIPSFVETVWVDTGVAFDFEENYQKVEIWESAPELYNYTEAYPEAGVKISNHADGKYADSSSEYYYFYVQNSTIAPNTVDTTVANYVNNNNSNKMFGTKLFPFAYEDSLIEKANQYRLVIPNCLDGNFGANIYIIFFTNPTVNSTTGRIYCQNKIYSVVEDKDASGKQLQIIHKYEDIYLLDLSEYANGESTYDDLHDYTHFAIMYLTTIDEGQVNQSYVDNIGNSISIKKLNQYSSSFKFATDSEIAESNAIKEEYLMNYEPNYVGYTRARYTSDPEYTVKYGNVSEISEHFKMAMVKNGQLQYYLNQTNINLKANSSDPSKLDGTDGDMMIVNDCTIYYIIGPVEDYDVVLFNLIPFEYKGVQASKIDPRGDTPSFSYIDDNGVAHYCRNENNVSVYQNMTNLVGKYVPSYDGNNIVYEYDSFQKFINSGAYRPTYGKNQSQVEVAAMAKNSGTSVYTNEDLLSKEILMGLLYGTYGTRYLHNINLFGSAFSGTNSSNIDKISSVFNETDNSYALNGIRFKDTNNEWVYDSFNGGKLTSDQAGNSPLNTSVMLTNWNSPWEIMEQHLVASYAVEHNIQPNTWFIYNSNEYKYQNVADGNLLSDSEMTCLVYKKFSSKLTSGYYGGNDVSGTDIEYVLYSSLFNGWVIDNNPHEWLTGINIVQNSDKVSLSGSNPLITYDLYIERDYTKYIMNQNYTVINSNSLYDFESVYTYAGSITTTASQTEYGDVSEDSFLVPTARSKTGYNDYFVGIIQTDKFVADPNNADGKVIAQSNNTNVTVGYKIGNGVKWGYGNYGSEMPYVLLYCWHPRTYTTALAGYSSFVCQNVNLG